MKKIAVLFSLFASISCSPRLVTHLINQNEIKIQPDLVSRSNPSGIETCFDPASYVLDTLHRDHTPMRYLRVSFHFVNSKDSTHNFKEDSGRVFAHRLLHVMQLLFDSNNKLWLPLHNKIPVIPVNIQYVLTGIKKADQGIYFHYDDQLYSYIHVGPRSNNASREVIDQYGLGTDSIINIFIMPHHPDSVKSKTYQSGCVGIALGTSLKIAGVYEKALNEWNVRGTFNHEIGHILGLEHAWTYDGCEDTPLHDNKCWVPEMPGCKDNTSNNMMDYNAWQSALSPCQTGIIHKNLSDTNSSVRKLLVPTWCQYDKNKTVNIQDSIVWLGSRDMEGDIEILPNASLTVKCRVSMPKGSRILVHPGGKLILENGLIHNACGYDWNNIQVLSQGNKTGQVIRIVSVDKKGNDSIGPVNKLEMRKKH